MRILLISCTLIISTLFFGCSKTGNQPSGYSDLARFSWSQLTSELATITVLNQYGEPVKQAQVLIGLADGVPFKGNYVTTDSQGIAKIPSEWISEQHVTVDADGYIRQTLLNQPAGNIVIRMNPAYLPTPVQMTGNVTSLPIVNGDKMVDFGLVIPAMTRTDLLNFDFNTVISPYNDSFTVAGQQANVPSNISLPTQKESYIFNLTISKPIYRVVTPTLGPKIFFAVRGQFPFKAVIDEMRAGKKFYQLINYFSIQGGGVRDITLINPNTSLDIAGNELAFNAKLKVQPAVAAADEVLIVVAVSDVANSLIPTDLKRPTGNSPLILTSLANRPAYIVNVVKKESEFSSTTVGSDRMSAAIAPYTENISAELLPLMANPSISGTSGYLISAASLPTKPNINALAMTAVISDLQDVQSDANKITTVNRRWEIAGLGWQQSIQLPNWPLSSSNGKKRIELNFVGSTTHTRIPLEILTDAATHVTHSSIDF